ncbi:hypothetical protein [Nonomuraea rubra]|uniref:hypothetical protein n=1 Tax=Nonomuraea rubra TaxID=46180 RepID=UPI0033F06C01
MVDHPNEQKAQAPPASVTLDPSDRGALVEALTAHLIAAGVDVKRKPSINHPRASVIIRCSGGGLTQDVAISPHPDQDGRWLWFWLWADGLRGEGPLRPEQMCPGEEIETATTAVAKVLGVRPVAV